MINFDDTNQEEIMDEGMYQSMNGGEEINYDSMDRFADETSIYNSGERVGDESVEDEKMERFLDAIKTLYDLPDEEEDDGSFEYKFKTSIVEGNFEVVKDLIDNNVVNVNFDDDYGIKWASRYGHVEIIEYLIGKGANIHADNDTPLKYAMRYGYLDILKLLVDNGVNINSLKNEQFYLMQSREGNYEMIKYLIDNGMDMKKGTNPLNYLLDSLSRWMGRGILDDNELLTVKNVRDIKPLSEEEIEGKLKFETHIENCNKIAELYIVNGIYDDESIVGAIRCGLNEVIDMLIERKAFNVGCLSVAIKCGLEDIFYKILEIGGYKITKLNDAFREACNCNNLKIVKTLIDMGCRYRNYHIINECNEKRHNEILKLLYVQVGKHEYGAIETIKKIFTHGNYEVAEFIINNRENTIIEKYNIDNLMSSVVGEYKRYIKRRAYMERCALFNYIYERQRRNTDIDGIKKIMKLLIETGAKFMNIGLDKDFLLELFERNSYFYRLIEHKFGGVFQNDLSLLMK